MKKVLSIAAALSVAATASFANANFPVEVSKDGVLYNCSADVTVVDGATTRQCITAGGSSEAGGGLFALAGLGGAAGLALGVLGVVVIATAIDNNDDDSTVGTN